MDPVSAVLIFLTAMDIVVKAWDNYTKKEQRDKLTELRSKYSQLSQNEQDQVQQAINNTPRISNFPHIKDVIAERHAKLRQQQQLNHIRNIDVETKLDNASREIDVPVDNLGTAIEQSITNHGSSKRYLDQAEQAIANRFKSTKLN